MTECLALSERMAAVAHGADQWSADDLAHIAACRDCADEWRLVQTGAALHAGQTVDAQRIAGVVIGRLRSEPARRGVLRQIPWRGGAIGLIAAAASVALIVSAPHAKAPRPGAGADTAAAIAMLPELQGLDDSQLEVMLRSLGPTAGDAAPGLVPHLEDLTDGELEQLIQAKGEQ